MKTTTTERDPARQRFEATTGHAVVVNQTPGKESVEVHDPNGRIEVTIRLTPRGSEISFSGTRLNLKASRIEVDCDEFALKASEKASFLGGEVQINSDSHTRIEAPGDLRLKGERLLLNCENM